MRLKIKPTQLLVTIFLLAIIIYWAVFWIGVVGLDELGNLRINSDSMWADWAAHLTMVNRMALGDKLILDQSPFVIGYPFSYPFVANLISALLIKTGLSVIISMTLTSFAYCVFGTVLLYIFLKKIYNSAATAIVGTIIFYLGGGFGFTLLPDDFTVDQGIWNFLTHLPHKYTHQPELSLHLLNVIEGAFAPQRAFTLGFPVTLIILIFLLTNIRRLKLMPIKSLFLSAMGLGVVIGLMPLIHTHSFLALFFILAAWSIGSFFLFSDHTRKKLVLFWGLLLATSLLISIPIYYSFFAQNIHQEFIHWQPGWYASEDHISWLYFWWWNWGLTPILAILAGIKLIKESIKKHHDKNYEKLVIFAPFIIIFVLINLIKFQPNIWDNTKLWIWSSVGISSLAAHYLVATWKNSYKKSPVIKHSIRIGLIIIFFISITSGLLDAFRAVNFKLHSYVMYSAEELSLAEWVKKDTPIDSIWLTSDKHNHWLDNLSGRQALLGYRGWLWTHGYKSAQVEKDIHQMFSRPQSNQHLFKQYDIDYVVIGPHAKKEWQAQTQNFSHLNLIKSSNNYQVYEL
jgi:hypothetical protein